jgi:imidazolonepropionase-like amidohydrolase
VGGPAFGLKGAIDEGTVNGPRIYPSGAVITVTSGHGDFRQVTELPRTIGGMLTRMEQIGGAMVADSPTRRDAHPRAAHARRLVRHGDTGDRPQPKLGWRACRTGRG